MSRLFLLLFYMLALAMPGSAFADVSTWIDPSAGKEEISSTPPVWYVKRVPGPRVRVFRGNKLIDDTAMPEEERKAIDPNRQERDKNGQPAPAANAVPDHQ